MEISDMIIYTQRHLPIDRSVIRWKNFSSRRKRKIKGDDGLGWLNLTNCQANPPEWSRRRKLFFSGIDLADSVKYVIRFDNLFLTRDQILFLYLDRLDGINVVERHNRRCARLNIAIFIQAGVNKTLHLVLPEDKSFIQFADECSIFAHTYTQTRRADCKAIEEVSTIIAVNKSFDANALVLFIYSFIIALLYTLFN